MLQRLSCWNVSHQIKSDVLLLILSIHQSPNSTMCCENFLGSISTHIGQLTALQTLHMQSNLLTGPVPSQIGRLTALNELRLQANQLTGTLPTEIALLTRLARFLVTKNALFGPIPAIPSQITVCELGDTPMPIRNCFNCSNLPASCQASCNAAVPCIQPSLLTNGPRTTPIRPSFISGTRVLDGFTALTSVSPNPSISSVAATVSDTVPLEESMTDMESGPISVKLITIIAASVGGGLLLVGGIAIVVCVVCTRRAKRDARIFAVTSSNAARKSAAADQYSSGDVVNFGTATQSVGTQSTSGGSNTSSYASAGFVSARDEYDSGNVYI